MLRGTCLWAPACGTCLRGGVVYEAAGPFEGVAHCHG